MRYNLVSASVSGGAISWAAKNAKIVAAVPCRSTDATRVELFGGESGWVGAGGRQRTRLFLSPRDLTSPRCTIFLIDRRRRQLKPANFTLLIY